VTSQANLLRQRLPFAGLLAAAAAGILVAAAVQIPSAVFAAASLFALVAWVFHRRTAWTLIAVAAAFATVQVWQTRESPARALVRILGSGRTVATAVGTVADEPAPFGQSRIRFTLALKSLTFNGSTFNCPVRIVIVTRGPAPGRGDVVRATGSLQAIPPPRNPGQFDARAWLARQGITCGIDISAPPDLVILSKASGFSLPRIAQRCREWMEATLRSGISDDPVVCDLIAGMVLGVTTALPDTLQQEFRNTGTFHLFSVSGLHVGMIGLILWQALKMAGANRRAAALIIIPALFFYVLITGWKAASLRAAVMAAIFLVGITFSQRPVPLNSLCAAGFLILLQSTSELFNPGFQFSFLVVASILVLAGPLHSLIRHISHPDPFLPRQLWSRRQQGLYATGEHLGGLTAVSLAAWAGSFPLTVAYFHLVSLSALPANLVIVPLAFAIMATAALALAGGVVWMPLASVFNNANWAFTKVLLAVVQAAATLPGSYFYFGLPSRSAATITVFDFGEGGAAAVETGGRLWMIDCGSAWQFESVVAPWLHGRGKRGPDGLVLTHGDARHIGGAHDLIASHRPEIIVESALNDRSPHRGRLHKELELMGIPKSIQRQGDRIALTPHASLTVLHPPAGLAGNEADDKVLVLLLEAGDKRVLFLSDAGPATEQWLLANERDQLRADVLVTGRHRSGLPIDTGFLAAVSPNLVVRAQATDLPAAPKDARLAEFLKANNIRLLSQDATGAVTIEITGGQIRPSSFVETPDQPPDGPAQADR